ncbi:MAG: homocysteine S-methyltransferase family protein [Anaerolineales bacterium]|jgi:5-methyltetrahydrofolate--homocysteine methyltransferase
MNLLEMIKNSDKPLLIDGGMGTQLHELGAPMGGTACLTHPETVLAVHKSYVEQGVQLLITNTLTMNRVHIEFTELGVDVREVNLAGARLARQAATGGQFVLGDISSTGQILEPFGELAPEDAYATFKEQAEILAEGGVDGFIIETMFDINETVLAVKACKEAADLPVIASMTFETIRDVGRTIMGNTAADCARALTEAGADVVGANCGSLSPMEMAEIAAQMTAATHLPVIIQPNAGKPRLVGTDTIFDMPPEDFAEGIAACLRNGATIVGGCCGTTPEHIRVLSEVVDK